MKLGSGLMLETEIRNCEIQQDTKPMIKPTRNKATAGKKKNPLHMGFPAIT